MAPGLGGSQVATFTTLHSAGCVKDGVVTCHCDKPARRFISNTAGNPQRYEWKKIWTSHFIDLTWPACLGPSTSANSGISQIKAANFGVSIG